VIRQIGLAALFVLLIVFLLQGCASSSDEPTTTGSVSQSAGTVPGEKTGEDRFAPSAGPMGPGGSVRW
jgi:hypothetical protein